MKNLFQKVLNAVKNPEIQKFSQKLDSQAPPQVVHQKIQGKIVVQSHQKLQIENQIEKLVFQNRYTPIRKELQDACEIVHYALMNSTPVDTKYIYMLLPSINLQYEELQKEEYNEYLKFKHNVHDYREKNLIVEDPYGMRDSQSPSGHKSNLDPSKWKGDSGKVEANSRYNVFERNGNNNNK